jgi:CRISPR/Cas system-associated exonuclease Cas4 (RecB family)
VGAIDTDPAWSDRRSWVWTQPPVFANRYVRLFRCNHPATLAKAGQAP